MLAANRAEYLALHGVSQDELRPLVREQIQQAGSNVGDIDAANGRLGAQRAGTRWYQRGRRAEIDHAVADHRIAREQWQDQHDRLVVDPAERADPHRPELWRARDALARLDTAAELGREHARPFRGP